MATTKCDQKSSKRKEIGTVCLFLVQCPKCSLHSGIYMFFMAFAMFECCNKTKMKCEIILFLIILHYFGKLNSRTDTVSFVICTAIIHNCVTLTEWNEWNAWFIAMQWRNQSGKIKFTRHFEIHSHSHKPTKSFHIKKVSCQWEKMLRQFN